MPGVTFARGAHERGTRVHGAPAHPPARLNAPGDGRLCECRCRSPCLGWGAHGCLARVHGCLTDSNHLYRNLLVTLQSQVTDGDGRAIASSALANVPDKHTIFLSSTTARHRPGHLPRLDLLARSAAPNSWSIPFVASAVSKLVSRATDTVRLCQVNCDIYTCLQRAPLMVKSRRHANLPCRPPPGHPSR